MGVVVAVISWGVYTSVRSARSGPSWAMVHFHRSVPPWLVVLAVGIVLAIVVRPAWAGAAVAYAAGTAALLAWVGSRSLTRILTDSDRGLDQVPEAYRSDTVRRTRNGLALLSVVCLLPLAAGLPALVSWVMIVMAIVFGVGAVGLSAPVKSSRSSDNDAGSSQK